MHSNTQHKDNNRDGREDSLSIFFFIVSLIMVSWVWVWAAL